MYCAHCGSELPPTGTVCARCGFTTEPPAPSSPGSSDPLEQLLREAERAAKELAAATVKLSERLATHAENGAKDPAGTARKVRDRLKKEIDSIVRDVSAALRKL